MAGRAIVPFIGSTYVKKLPKDSWPVVMKLIRSLRKQGFTCTVTERHWEMGDPPTPHFDGIPKVWEVTWL